MSTPTLGWKDGWLCAVEQEPESTTPVMATYYWPLLRDARSVWDADLGKPLHRDGPYHYSLGWRRFRLAQDGQTRPVAVEHTPIPKPARLRVPVRWHYGRWQKYDRKKGWITA
jgi:hypothetical protein